jgi:hypothetical protein
MLYTRLHRPRYSSHGHPVLMYVGTCGTAPAVLCQVANGWLLPSGLWCLPGLINHSCAPNSIRWDHMTIGKRQGSHNGGRLPDRLQSHLHTGHTLLALRSSAGDVLFVRAQRLIPAGQEVTITYR